VASSNAPLVKFSVGATRSWIEANIFDLGGEVNSYLRANVAQPYRFTLGGPMRLAALPTGLGHGLYGFFGYEAGEVWSPEARAILRLDGFIGLVANSPSGLFTFGVSDGDAGHRKVFLTLGRLF
jgi:NTE family protein